MAKQTFTNAPINDKRFVALQVPPKAPTRKISNVFGNQPDANEFSEILFQANNVLRTDENPTLSFLDEDEHVQAPPNTPSDDVEHVTHHAQDPSSRARMKRLEANRVYAARHRFKKLARINELVRQMENMQMEVAMIQSQLAGFETICNWLHEENAKMKACCDIMVQRNTEQDGSDSGDTLGEKHVLLLMWATIMSGWRSEDSCGMMKCSGSFSL